MNHRERVLEFIAAFPGRDDDEISTALKIAPRQIVNTICRGLSKDGLARREQGAQGKLVNYRTSHPVVTAQEQKRGARSPGGAVSASLSEDQVKAALSKWLEASGWSVQVAWGRARGIDITALRAGERWIIECKGSGSSAPMQNNYFLGVVGELLQRMSDDSSKHSIAFPEIAKFRRLWSELPTNVKQRLKLTALFVAVDGAVTELVF